MWRNRIRKTTLVDIIVGIKKPSKGKIIIDEKELTNNNLKNWLQNIAYVPQRVFCSIHL